MCDTGLQKAIHIPPVCLLSVSLPVFVFVHVSMYISVFEYYHGLYMDMDVSGHENGNPFLVDIYMYADGSVTTTGFAFCIYIAEMQMFAMVFVNFFAVTVTNGSFHWVSSKFVVVADFPLGVTLTDALIRRSCVCRLNTCLPFFHLQFDSLLCFFIIQDSIIKGWWLINQGQDSRACTFLLYVGSRRSPLPSLSYNFWETSKFDSQTTVSVT